jgi:hypothetical protein
MQKTESNLKRKAGKCSQCQPSLEEIWQRGQDGKEVETADRGTWESNRRVESHLQTSSRRKTSRCYRR